MRSRARPFGGRPPSRLHFDVVIGADNQALEFLVANRSSLFAGVPIVFCSVDDYSPDMLKGQRDITGVTGELDFEGTISLARRLHPGIGSVREMGMDTEYIGLVPLFWPHATEGDRLSLI